MTALLLGEKRMAGDDSNKSEAQSTFDRLLKDYFEPQTECAAGSTSDNQKGESCTETWTSRASQPNSKSVRALRKFDAG
jgi:hypothetical protein